jgi:hypothetical protein
MVQAFNESDKGGCLPFRREDRMTWGSACLEEPEATDLVTLLPRRHSDRFSCWVCDQSPFILKFFGRFLKFNKKLGGIVIFDGEVERYTLYLIALLAGLVPLSMVYILTQCQTIFAQFGCMAVGNIVMLTCLFMFTAAERESFFLVGVL